MIGVGCVVWLNPRVMHCGSVVWKKAKFSVKGGCLSHQDFIDVVWKVWENQKEGEL